MGIYKNETGDHRPKSKLYKYRIALYIFNKLNIFTVQQKYTIRKFICE